MNIVTQSSNVQTRARRRIAFRILPFLLVLYVIAFLDRVNVGYAALGMTNDLRFSDRVFGLGAGIFFVGYLLFQIPGALVAERSSARRLLTGVLIAWGIVTILTAHVNSAMQFYVVRLMVGIAEAAFFPALIVYITHWFRATDRAKAVAIFMAAVPASNIIGSPFAGWVLSAHWLNMPGWKWLFIFEGIPAIVFGVTTWFYLTDRPSDAKWLQKEEQTWISEELRVESAQKSAPVSMPVAQVLRKPEILLLALAYWCGLTATYGFVFWLPTILKRATGLSTLSIGLLAIAPYLVALIVMVWSGWHSDHTAERRWHTAIQFFLAAISLGIALLFQSHLLVAYCAMVIVGMGTIAFMPTFWALTTDLVGAKAGAAAVGLINSCGAVGGFIGPFLIGYLSSLTKSFVPGLLLLVGALLLGGAAILCLPRVPIAKVG